MLIHIHGSSDLIFTVCYLGGFAMSFGYMSAESVVVVTFVGQCWIGYCFCTPQESATTEPIVTRRLLKRAMLIQMDGTSDVMCFLGHP